MSCSRKRQFHYGCNALWSKLVVSAYLERCMVNSPVSALLECFVVKIGSFSMSRIRCAQNCQFQNVWNVLWLKSLSPNWHRKEKFDLLKT
jgi:hypothetical protein